MITTKRLAYALLLSLVALVLAYSPVAQAQNWMALPPYNTLWPLWSPALSPVDSITGLPVPIVSELTPATVLPVQPGLTWDPAAAEPWLLYNTPIGMAYYDPIGGVNLWPPSYLLDASGSPLPVNLPLDYELLPPTASSWINTNVPLGNAALLAYLMVLPSPVLGTVPTTWVPPVPPTTWVGPTIPTTFVGPTIPTTWVPPVPPTTWVGPTIPTTFVGPTIPTTWVPPVPPTTWVGPTIPTTFVGPTIPTTFVGPTFPTTFVAPTISPIFPTFLAPSAII
ncbi:MAG: hypothetical protein AB1847_20410 [bacterium]